MDKKTFAIGVLSLTAVILFVANLIAPLPQASANFVVKDRDYTAVTAVLTPNDEGIYITDNRSGKMVLFSFNPNTKSLQIRDIKDIMDAFATAPEKKGK
jgi:hypothetical protein